ncbi:MAG: hypothetical protein ACREOU_04270 [Candidatus Eiseniibacteriota bacterium]
MNRRGLLFSVVALAALGVSSVAFAVPVPGIYSSTDLGGALLTGRASQSWTAPLNAAQGLNDVFNSQSWNGAALGTQWAFSCGVQPAAQGVVDNRDGSGTGTVVFTNSFSGGNFYLNPGPWGDGTGTLNSTVEIVTVVYVGFVPQASVVNINSSGQFNGSNCLLTFAIANGNGLGDTDILPFPAGFPPLIDTACAPTRLYGSWGEVRTITMRIDCPVPTNGKTWGALKAIYR